MLAVSFEARFQVHVQAKDGTPQDGALVQWFVYAADGVTLLASGSAGVTSMSGSVPVYFSVSPVEFPAIVGQAALPVGILVTKSTTFQDLSGANGAMGMRGLSATLTD